MKITISNTPHFYSGPWGFLAQVVVMTLATLLATWILPGVTIDSVAAAVLTAVVIALLNRLASGLVSRFHVDGFGSALLFSLLLTLFNYLLEIPNKLMRRPKYKEPSQGPDADADGFTPYEEIKDDNE